MIAALPSIVSRLRLKQLRLLIALDEQGSLHRAEAVMPLAVAQFSEGFGMVRPSALSLQSRRALYGVIVRHGIGSGLSSAARLLLEEMQAEQLPS